MRFRGCRTRGFTLVEIAIVLVVIGLIVSGGLLGISPVLQANKVSQTNAQLDKIEQTLVLYVIQNGCLPCPANPATLTGNSHDNADYATGCGNAAACAPTHGVVPWVNLGLSKNDVIDPFGYYIDYVPSPGLNLNNTSMQRLAPSSYPAGTLKVNDGASPQNQQTAAAAYVLISHGPDGSGGYSGSNGAVKTDPNASNLQSCNITGQASCVAAPAYVQNTPLSIAYVLGYFDDIVRFRTAPLIIQLCGSNACGNPA